MDDGESERGIRIGGALLVGLLAAWLLLSARAGGGDASPILLLLAACAASYAAARRLSARDPLLVPLLLCMLCAAFALLRLDTLLAPVFRAPLGYSNAAGSLFILAAAAAVVLAARARRPATVAFALLAAGAFFLVPLLNGTRTAWMLGLLLPLGLLARTPTAVRGVVAGAGAAVAGALATVVWLGSRYAGSPASTPLHERLTPWLGELRFRLWSDALAMAAENPLLGAGPGAFARDSPTVRGNADYPWVHNELLLLAAEAGYPATVLAVLLAAWCFARLWWGAGDRGTAVAAIALGALGVQASIDFVLHFPAIGMAAAAILGAASVNSAAMTAGRDGAGAPPSPPPEAHDVPAGTAATRPSRG